jgi:thiol-disulfide isomerase/thioredoxin
VERGNVVLLNVWATWCGPCRFEIPALDRLHKKYAAKGFKVVGVSIDEGEVAPVKQFVSEHEMHYPIVLDPQGKLASLFQTTVIPTSVLIDRKGKVVWKKYGVIEENEAQLLRAIEKSL